MKIAVAPTVLVLELAVYHKQPTPRVVASVLLVRAAPAAKHRPPAAAKPPVA